MCLIGLLFLIVLIICFVRRSKGGKYSGMQYAMLELSLQQNTSAWLNYCDLNGGLILQIRINTFALDLKVIFYVFIGLVRSYIILPAKVARGRNVSLLPSPATFACLSNFYFRHLTKLSP